MNHMKLKMYFVLFLGLFCNQSFSQNYLPFNRGINLTNWFQTDTSHISFGKYDITDFAQIKSLGVDAIRLPVDLKAMTGPAPDYKVSPTFLFFMDYVAHWADSLGIYLILDNHNFDPAVNTLPGVISWMKPAWQQIATHYLGKYPKMYFEILNEPHGISYDIWNVVQNSTVSGIRAIDADRIIVVGGVDFNSINKLNQITVSSDKKLIYTFHFYDPFLFTHQGASWASPSLESLSGMPFPYDVNKMPALPAVYNGTWIQSSYNDYKNQGTESKINEQIEIANTFRKTRKVPVWCGEFGVYIPNSPNDERTNWYRIVRQKLESDSIAWTIWDYQGGFGLFKKDTKERFDYDLNLPVVDALGFTSPAQLPDIKKPDSSQITIYTDWVHKGITNESYLTAGSFNLHYTQNPASGRHSVLLSNTNQYNGLQFKFSEIRDFTKLKADNYYVELSIKGTAGVVSLDLRFIDSKTSVSDHPWRSRVILNSSKVTWNNTWQTIQIPLKSFVESGSWDNAWFNPSGLFDWSSIERLEIIPEDQSLTGQTVFVDNIRITKKPAVNVEENELLPEKFQINSIYPNPFNPETRISGIVPTGNGHSTLTVFNLLGQSIRNLPITVQGNNEFSSVWNGRNEFGIPVSSGIYLVQLKHGSAVETRQVVLLK